MKPRPRPRRPSPWVDFAISVVWAAAAASIGTIVGGAMLLALVGCTPAPDLGDCGMHRLDDQYFVDYNIAIDNHTAGGIPVDSGGYKEPLTRIDGIAEDVSDCLRETFPDDKLPPEVVRDAMCSALEFDVESLDARGCWQVKIDPEWIMSCSGHQVLSQGPPGNENKQCGGKAAVATRDCPCRYRVAVQGRTFVATPDLDLLADGLVRATTSCKNPWGHPALSRCARTP